MRFKAIFLISGFLIASSSLTANGATVAESDWEQIFPQLPGYKVQINESRFESLKPVEISRSATYSNDKAKISGIKVTIARSQRFASLINEKRLPREAKAGYLNKKRHWLLKKGKGLQLMLQLDKQELALFAAESSAYQKELFMLASKLDTQKVQAALSDLLKDKTTALSLRPYKTLKLGTPMSHVLAQLGPPDHDNGEGDFKLVYELEDGSKVQVGGKSKLSYVQHIYADGSSENLL